MSPRSASSTAGSMRSPAYPAPEPILTVFIMGPLGCDTPGSEREDAQGDARERHEYRRPEEERRGEPLMFRQVDPGQPDDEEGRRGEGADREARGHLAQQGS